MTQSVVGVDGCAGGWFAVWTADGDEPPRSGRYESIEAVVDDHAAADTLLLDMPIGLPDSEPRACDSAARQRLGARSSSVFPVPCRAVVDYVQREGDTAAYDHANTLQREQLGSGLSKQAWNITPKIAAVDTVLRNEHPTPNIRESHPECCFAALNDWYPIAQPKSTASGRAARFGVLDSELDGWRDCYQTALDEHYRKHLARDDIIDALVLVAAGQHALTSLPAEPPTDQAGLSMEIVVPAVDPSWHQHLSVAEQ